MTKELQTKKAADCELLFFVFLGLERAWDHVLGAKKQPEGQLFVYRALPGNVVAWGSNREEAVRRLREAVDFSMATAESPDAWYEGAVKRLSADDVTEQKKAMAQVWQEGGARLREVLLAGRKAAVLETTPILRPTSHALPGACEPISA